MGVEARLQVGFNHWLQAGSSTYSTEWFSGVEARLQVGFDL